MRYHLNINFESDSLSGPDYITLFNKLVNFTPECFRRGYKTNPWKYEKDLKMFSKLDKDENFSFFNHTMRCHFDATVTAGYASYKSIDIVENMDFMPKNVIIEELIEKNSFISCYLYEEDYVNQQDARRESDYKIYGIPLELSKDLPYTIDIFGSKVFDISSNPGRSHVLNHSGITAAFKMWF